MKILVDAMGGDNAPLCVLQGASQASAEFGDGMTLALLGAAKPVIKAHGSSHAKGIKNAIRQAKLCVANDLCGTMEKALGEVAAQKEEEADA